MSYKSLGGKLSAEQSENGWQVRISIHPRALIATDPNNKISTIEKILKDISKDYLVDIKLWTFATENDLYLSDYDGTTSRTGKDREQRGKEVCIFIPDTQHATFADNYKKMLLSLWSKLQKAGVPLMHMDIPGDQKLYIEPAVPTPFSITSYSRRQEWLDRHGILFKRFEAYDDQHPILKVKLLAQDLKAYGVQYDLKEIAKSHWEYYVTHRNDAMRHLKEDINQLVAQDHTYREVLFKEDIIQYFIGKMEYYQETLTRTEIEERGAFQEDFKVMLGNDEVVKFILDAYPHKPDSRFTEHDALSHLRQFNRLSKEKIAELFKELRDDYDKLLEDIKSDFDKQATGDNRTPETIKIGWKQYLQDPMLDITGLIERNPMKMQCIYRRCVLLAREKQAHKHFKQALKATAANDNAFGHLLKLEEVIQIMAEKAAKQEIVVSPEVPRAFVNLYGRIQNEMAMHRSSNFNDTPYPIVIEHFTKIANDINAGKNFQVAELKQSWAELNEKLVGKAPASGALKGVMWGVFGAIVGFILGFGAGAAVSFWGFGFAAIPATIVGAVAGAGVGASGATTGFVGGFFSGKHNEQAYRERVQLVSTMKPEMNTLYEGLGLNGRSR